MNWNKKVKEMEFKVFCQNRDWVFASFTYNPKNTKQFIGACFDADGNNLRFLITDQKYYQLLGDKKYKEVSFVLEAVADEKV